MNDYDKVQYDLRQIMRALDWWNEGGWKSSNAVGAIIQQKAQKLLGIHADMTTLRTEAESQLKQHEAEEKKITLNMLPGQLAQSLSSMAPWKSMAFPLFTPPLTRRGELEGYTDGQIRELYKEHQAKEVKKERINYILESEKEYK